MPDMQTRTCAWCGGEFETSGPVRHCSRECHDAAMAYRKTPATARTPIDDERRRFLDAMHLRRSLAPGFQLALTHDR